MECCQGINCWAHIQWFCEHAGVIRVFAERSRYRIDPYCICIPFFVKEKFNKIDKSGKRGYIEFVGLSEKLNICQFRAIRNTVYLAGWGVLMTRIKDGKEYTVEICKKKWYK